MSMNQWAVRTVAGAAMVLASVAFGSAQAATGLTQGGITFTRIANTAIEVAPTTPLLAQTQTADLFVNAAGVFSFDGPGAAGNTMLTFNATPGALVDQVSYNVSLTTFGESWMSEAVIVFLNSTGDGVALSGVGGDEPGSASESGNVSLVSLGLQFNIGSDGLLMVEFYESFDDVPGAADAQWTAGGISFGNIGVVPEPGTYGLMALGLLAVAGAARRRA